MRFNLGLVFSGLLFFALPNFNLLDIMPDFIGAALILAGLSKMYMYDGNFEDAKKAAKFLLWISVLRLALCFFTTSGGKRDYLVPFTFIICVLEAIYMISFFKGMYLGLEYTLMRSDCDKLTKKVHEAFTMSFIFVIASRVLEFAPQICEIYAQDAELDLSAGASFKMSMAQMKMYVSGACLVFGLILGVIYIFVTSDAWIRIIANKNYANFLKEKYENYLVDFREEHIASKLGLVYFLFTLCFVFIPDIYIDGINLVPSAITVLLVTAALLQVCRLCKKGTVSTVITSLFALLSSAACYLYMNRVHLGINDVYSLDTYNYKEFTLLEKEMSVYYATALSLAEFALTFALVLLLVSKMIRLFKEEKRTVAIPMLKVLCVPSGAALFSAALLKIFRTLEGHLATNHTVQGYVQNKAYITNKADYLEYMQNSLISGYEKISSTSYTLSVITVVLAVICLLYLMRIRRFTEGDYEKK